MNKIEQITYQFNSHSFSNKEQSKELALFLREKLKEIDADVEENLVRETAIDIGWWINFKINSKKYSLFLSYDDFNNIWFASIFRRNRFQYSLFKKYLSKDLIKFIRRLFEQKDIYNLTIK
jgi:hypothetical protein